MLTTPDFWDNYWQNSPDWQNVDVRRSYDRCFDQVFHRWLPTGSQYQLIEIGCAPGRWLIYFYQKFGYQVTGCDSAPMATVLTRANLARANVPGQIISANFFDGTLPAQTYDIVLSLGFVEHFADPWLVISKHIHLLKPGGRLVLEVPNYTGLNRWILAHGLHHYLELHNTRVMCQAFFEKIAVRFALVPLFIGFMGGVEPALWDATGQRWLLRNITRVANILRQKIRFLDHINHPSFSGYLIGIYQKEEK